MVFFGLLDAMEKFDHTRNIKFETYASLRIRGAIIDGLRSMDWVPRSTRSKARELENAVYELTNQLGRNPSDGEIAAALDLPRERYYDLLDEVRGVGLFSLDETLAAQDADDNLRMMDLVSTEEQSPAEILLHSETVEELAEAVQGGLTEREQLVLSLYYTDELTLKEIGHILEVSESRVSQIHTRVIMTLRGKFKESTERRGGNVSIKFPDFQVLVSRSEQIPVLIEGGDQSGAAGGKMAPQVSQDFDVRRQRVDHSRAKDKVRRRKEGEERRQGGHEEKQGSKHGKQRRPTRGRRIDLRA